ncbi:MAG: TIGR04053 family radical SAM/SPASM domain-containing protein [Chloroflexi bacterium]|nr:TIGR04053 family radical SAM/SPASM domain-containing protein [Chloroflexota bacterium]
MPDSTLPTPPPRPAYFDVDFAKTPYVVAWETTRACALACQHCRASAIPRRDPRELTTDEGKRLIDTLVELGRPILILTGGDPFMRRDLADLARYGVEQGLRVGLSPSATALVTRERLETFHDIGVSMVHVSVDGLEETHDGFRRVPGSFARTLEIMRDVRALGLPLQIGTTVTRQTVGDLPGVAALVREYDIQVWNVFFLVPTGRGQAADMLDANETETVLHWLWQVSKQVGFRVRTTAAQHYRRVVIQQERQARGLPADLPSRDVTWEATGAGYAFREGRAPQQQGVNDGKGFAFISHIGDVYPSGFLQQSAGNVRETSIVDLYRDHPLFRALRDPAQLLGKCAHCSYAQVCGGSRARAWALTGNPMADDPTCAYEPGGPVPPTLPLDDVFGARASLARILAT